MAHKTLYSNNFEILREVLHDKDFDNNWSEADDLRPIEEIPHPYQQVFAEYPAFNVIQSKVLDDVFYTDNSLVVSAPTGSGKTVIFELAIIRLLIESEKTPIDNLFKIVYSKENIVSPMKALCEERLVEWHKKFVNFGLNSISVTGDSDNIEFQNLFSHNLIITTPEKWDCLTRKWKDNKKLVQLIKLFMIDEVHLLNEECRGSSLETIVCRMKTIEESVNCQQETDTDLNHKIRFVAVSATIPNIEDIAEWLGKTSTAKYYKFSEEFRPVKLNKIVLGYQCKHSTPFKFDLALNYKLQSLMMQYSHGKPTLIFCSTRKIVEMTAKHILQHLTINLTPDQKERLMTVAETITDFKLKETIIHGVGYHHAGMLPHSRKAIEDLFRKNDLPILVTTSTLAVGVNLPAHLVIIKSTKCYTNGGFQDYTATALLQMIGRAGRPQFDTEATALILTTDKDKEKFEKIISGLEPIESNLHRHLTEHLNAEVVLQTITDLDVAMRWLSSTFLYIRAKKNPRHYALTMEPSSEQIDKKLLEMCQIELNKLVKAGMITIDQDGILAATSIGILMAKYYLAFETMKLFTQLNGGEILQQILSLISRCHEFSEMYLRVNDKKCLNLLNKCRNRETIRFPLNGKIKTIDMKINCIIQAVLGCLDICDHSILTETIKIMRNGERIVKCLIEYLEAKEKCYKALLSTITLAKCFRVRLWENSPYVSKQLPGIGTVLSSQLVNAGKTTFQAIAECDPREIELLINKKPPAGNRILEQIEHLPKYCLKFEILDNKKLHLIISLDNALNLQENSIVNLNSLMHLLVGDSLNNILLYEKYSHSYMIEHPDIIKYIDLKEKNVEEIEAHFISEDWVGIDCSIKYEFIPKQNSKEKTISSMLMCKDSINKKNKEENKTINISNSHKKKKEDGTKIHNVNNIIKRKKENDITYMQKFMEMYMKYKKSSIKSSEKNSTSIDISTQNDSNNITKEQEPENNKKDENANKNKIILHSNIRICDNDNHGDVQNSDIQDLLNLAESLDEEEMFDNNEENDNQDENCIYSESDHNNSYTMVNNCSVKINKHQDLVSNTELTCDSENNHNIDSSLGFQKYKFTPKKLSHKRYSGTEMEPQDLIISPAGKKIRFDEQIDKKPKNQTKITWRSPLTYSPPVKFSPKINYSHLNANNIKAEDAHECSLVSMNEETHSTSTITNVLQDLSRTRKSQYVLPYQPPMKLKPSNSKSFFPLSDIDHANTSIEENNETQHKILDDLSEFAALSSFGLIRTPRRELKNNSVTRISAINSPSNSTAEYYSQLLTQPQTRIDSKDTKEQDYCPKYMKNKHIFNKRTGCDNIEATGNYCQRFDKEEHPQAKEFDRISYNEKHFQRNIDESGYSSQNCLDYNRSRRSSSEVDCFMGKELLQDARNNILYDNREKVLQKKPLHTLEDEYFGTELHKRGCCRQSTNSYQNLGSRKCPIESVITDFCNNTVSQPVMQNRTVANLQKENIFKNPSRLREREIQFSRSMVEHPTDRSSNSRLPYFDRMEPSKNYRPSCFNNNLNTTVKGNSSDFDSMISNQCFAPIKQDFESNTNSNQNTRILNKWFPSQKLEKEATTTESGRINNLKIVSQRNPVERIQEPSFFQNASFSNREREYHFPTRNIVDYDNPKIPLQSTYYAHSNNDEANFVRRNNSPAKSYLYTEECYCPERNSSCHTMLEARKSQKSNTKYDEHEMFNDSLNSIMAHELHDEMDEMQHEGRNVYQGNQHPHQKKYEDNFSRSIRTTTEAEDYDPFDFKNDLPNCHFRKKFEDRSYYGQKDYNQIYMPHESYYRNEFVKDNNFVEEYMNANHFRPLQNCYLNNNSNCERDRVHQNQNYYSQQERIRPPLPNSHSYFSQPSERQEAKKFMINKFFKTIDQENASDFYP